MFVYIYLIKGDCGINLLKDEKKFWQNFNKSENYYDVIELILIVVNRKNIILLLLFILKICYKIWFFKVFR